MNKALLLISLLSLFSGGIQAGVTTGEKTFNKVQVKVFSDNKVHVFKDGVKMFGAFCEKSPTCMVYTTNSDKPIYKYDYGELRLGGDKPGSIYKLSLDNIKEYQPNKYRDNKYISFIVITTGGSAGSQRGRYDIDTEHGWHNKEETEFDWLRYGRQEDY